MSFLQGGWVRIIFNTSLFISLQTVTTEALLVTHNPSLNVAGENSSLERFLGATVPLKKCQKSFQCGRSPSFPNASRRQKRILQV